MRKEIPENETFNKYGEATREKEVGDYRKIRSNPNN